MVRYTARVIVASNRAAEGVYADRAGPVIADWLAQRSYQVPDPVVVGDGEPVAQALREALAQDVRVVITTGGTGMSPTDRTPEMTAPLLEYELVGLADAVRDAGREKVPTAVLSRGLAGVAGGTVVVNLPGSTGGVRDGLAVLDDVLEHAVHQLAGGDHAQQGPGDAEASGDPSERVLRAEVTDSPVSVPEHRALVEQRAAGAVVVFEGVVRDHDHGRSVLRMDYESHPSAGDVLRRVVTELANKRAGTRAVAVSHRSGGLEIGDVALVCVVSAEHRAEAFATCGELVDEVKEQLPMWKHQWFADGTDEWVNSP